MNLFQKGLLAFAVVILVAVVTVAVLAGYQTETEFRRYAVLYSGRTQRVAEALVAYYRTRGGWQGLQAELPDLLRSPGGRGSQGGAGQGAQDITYTVADAESHIVATTAGAPGGQLSRGVSVQALPLTLEGVIVGYLVPESTGEAHAALDAPGTQFLTRLRWILALGGVVALLVAFPLAGILTRGIVAPVRTLTQTAETIAEGRFDVRADVGGKDEIARLAATFNRMAGSLQRAEEMRHAQTADIAHELRNPLAVLQSSLEALADGIYSPTPENLDPALDQVQTLNRLVEDLRTLALADAGQLHLDVQPIDLNALVARIAESHRDALEQKGVALAMDLAHPLPDVSADYARVTQVLNNLLTNVSRYVPAGSVARLATVRASNGVIVRVADNGPGVPAEELPRLFDRFWRGEPSRSRVTGGSGLGLSIAYQVIAAHSGRIWAEPTLGGGLTINFWLPYA